MRDGKNKTELKLGIYKKPSSCVFIRPLKWEGLVHPDYSGRQQQQNTLFPKMVFHLT